MRMWKILITSALLVLAGAQPVIASEVFIAEYHGIRFRAPGKIKSLIVPKNSDTVIISYEKNGRGFVSFEDFSENEMPGSGCKAKEVFLEALSSAKADELKCDKRAVSAIKFVFKHGGTAKERKIGPYRIILVDTKDTHHLFVYDENGGMVKIDSDGLASDDLAEAIVIDKKDGHE